jgi:hypothetical protein
VLVCWIVYVYVYLIVVTTVQVGTGDRGQVGADRLIEGHIGAGR